MDDGVTHMISQQRLVNVPSAEITFKRRAICCAARAHSSRYRRASASGMLDVQAAPLVNWVAAVATSNCRYSKIMAPRYMIWKQVSYC
jgi:hypothetical protein